ncbi:MAG: crossover junction endodeoxyribonuclease RuvC [Candidatus Berkelbacteria bacterium]
MRILGIDPGTTRCGWGVIDVDKKDGKVAYVAHGCIESDKLTNTQERLMTVFRNVSNLIVDYKPDQVSLELLFMFNNQKTVMKISEARGVILLACGQNGMMHQTYEYTPMQVKMAVTGYGRSDKKQVVEEVKKAFPEASVSGGKKDGFDDAADALAVAMAHFHKYVSEEIQE